MPIKKKKNVIFSMSMKTFKKKSHDSLIVNKTVFLLQRPHTVDTISIKIPYS